MFAEAAVCVQRVVLQYEDAEAGEAGDGDAVIRYPRFLDIYLDQTLMSVIEY